ncbi:MAG: hypothetical protein JOZ62_04815 [Acidobacteriaceae bacterium]|nr:hypothetical protein [Acidobacteriaceae bacterium]
MPLRMHIETIPHESQRYPTVGDYWCDENGIEQIRVSEMMDWRYEVLVAVHEIVEMALTRQRGISEEGITEFDVKFEENKSKGLVGGEAGDNVNAPYRKEHFFATNLERLFAAELGVDWFEYDRYVDALGFKK